ncbi:MAG TPA: hypothetical protein VK741_05195 [Acetobacteraceae bacterium]|nr:hypothetical protein [Acetobacteraceae bacterium]
MLQGHVDRITRQVITGWAADDAAPDERVAVSIFVNGRKLAQLACDQPRPDLRHMGLFGEGRHGFRYEFAPALPIAEAAKIAVRFADSGMSLGHGNALLARGATEATVVAAPLRKQEQLIVPAPVDPRTLFRLFALLEPPMELYTLLCRLDFGRVRPSHLDYSVMGQVPEVQPRGLTWSPPLARDYLNDLMYSPRFQQNVVPFALRAFPEKQRLMFVHIPKCAGSDLSYHLTSRFPSLEQRLMETSWTTKEELFEALAGFVRELAFADAVFVRGHIPLDFYADAGLVRPADRVFTIMRDPTEIALSQINYVLTKFQLNIDAGVVERDTEEWLHALDLKELPPAVTPQFVDKYARRILSNSEIVEPNSMCRWLGGGDAQAVVERLARHLVEVTDTAHYNPWLEAEWGISAATRRNESTKYVSLSTFGHQELGFIQDLSLEDRKLYSQVQQALTITGKVSVSGEDILNEAASSA